MTISTEALTEEVKTAGTWVSAVQNEISRVVVGQKYLVDRLLIGLLANGHVLLEGVPGLAKTLAVKTLASCVHTKFQRLQFTPDLLPADIIGTMIYNPRDGEFRPKLGPIFSNLILADAPSVQDRGGLLAEIGEAAAKRCSLPKTGWSSRRGRSRA